MTVLNVDIAAVTRRVESRDVESLFSVWKVFSGSVGLLRDGKRLENMSWRLLNRKTFCSGPVGEANITTPAIPILARSSEGQNATEVPNLFENLDSLASAALNITYPQTRRQGSVSRGHEPHITSDELIRIVMKMPCNLTPLAGTIPQAQQVFTPPPQIAESVVENKSSTTESIFESSAQSLSSESVNRSTTRVVRGFSPSYVSSSYGSIPLLCALSPISTAITTASKLEMPDDDDLETDDKNENESAIATDEWEDYNDAIDKITFQRVYSRVNIQSNCSLIANAIARTAASSRLAMAPQRLRTSSLNGHSVAASPDSDAPSLLMIKKGGLKPIAEIPRSAAQRIIQTTTNTTHQLVLSPRTTRRKMLATELTVSLRQNLLREHQQMSQTANVKRRHTAHDVANLKQYPDKVHIDKDDVGGINSSWNQYLSAGLGGYHSKGW